MKLGEHKDSVIKMYKDSFKASSHIIQHLGSYQRVARLNNQFFNLAHNSQFKHYAKFEARSLNGEYFLLGPYIKPIGKQNSGNSFNDYSKK